jgi:hypothetical protein
MRLSRLALAAVLPACLVAGAFAAAPQVVGIAAAVVNDVRIRAAGAAQFRPAALRQRVALADRVQTGANSRLQLQLLDRSVFSVGANASLTIDRFVYDPAGSSMSATVAKGAFRFLSGRRSGPGSTISTPVATIGIRGTILDGAVGERAIEIARGERALGRSAEGDPATATLVVLRGPGAARESDAAVGNLAVTAAGVTVVLDRPLLAAYVPRAGAAPIGPFPLSLPGLARLNELILSRIEPAPRADSPGTWYPAPDQRRPLRGPPGEFGDFGRGPDGPAGPGMPDFGTFPNAPPMRDRPQADQPRGQLQDRPAPVQTQRAVPQTAPSPGPSPAPSPAPAQPGTNQNGVTLRDAPTMP